VVNGQYVGFVSGHDPLHGFLSRILDERMGVTTTRPAFRAFRLSGTNEVYSYEEEGTGTKLVCKFYGPQFGWDRDRAAWMAHQEYANLETLRRFELVGSPHHVIRPLGLDRDINGVLATEYYVGEQFSTAIQRSTHDRDHDHLHWRLKALAFYLATQHNRTANGASVNFARETGYLDSLVQRLRVQDRVGQWDVDEFAWLRDRWRERPRMWRDRQVWLHGDATPANFLFGEGLDVAAIDLERMKRGDRAFDVGRVAGELQHAFLLTTGSRDGAEPFIGHFLWEYSTHFPDRESAFTALTGRTPYYMGLNLLRIAGNHYISRDYGGRLVAQAKELLRAP
jgi:aminoglycoside phosphotransferase (APT) family kinase protein